jgi:Uma2 family endonuclease
MALQDRREQLTATEFWEQIESWPQEKRFELINGEVIEMPPPGWKHSAVATELAYLLKHFVREQKLGAVMVEAGYTFAAAMVRVPDVSFIAAERKPKERPHDAVFVPDLAVEIISPSETPSLISEKTVLYLRSGVKLVWNIYLDTQRVEVWQADEAGRFFMQPLGADDTLDGGDVLPGFAVRVPALYEET